MSRAEELTGQMVAWLVDEMEAGSVDPTGWRMPWHRLGADQMTPTNVATAKPYRGGNRWSLALAAMMADLDGGTWGTFNQWRTVGHPIAKGHRAMAAIAVPIERNRTETNLDTGEDEEHRYLMFRQIPVFHSSQATDWQPEPIDGDHPEPIDAAAELLEHWRSAGMVIEHGGNRAYYSPGADKIRLPPLAQFQTAENYYATAAHEATHWTGHASRLDRDMSGRFGDQQYAAEELVAELGAATIAAHLGIQSVTRDDHAQYLAHWITILKEDPRHLWTIAGKAETAADHVLDLADHAEGHAA